MHPRYFMCLDGDDILSRRLVEFVLAHDYYDAFILRKGYREFEGLVFQLTWRFHRSCGSNYVSRWYGQEIPCEPLKCDDVSVFLLSNGLSYRDYWMVSSHVKDVESLFSQLGRSWVYVPFPAAIYRRHSASLESMQRNMEQRHARAGILRIKRMILDKVLRSLAWHNNLQRLEKEFPGVTQTSGEF